MNFTRDITMGRYYPTGSVLHRLDPRLKLCLLFCFSLAVLIFDSTYAYGILLLLLLGLMLISKVNLRLYFYNLRSLRWLYFFTFFLHITTTSGSPIVLFGHTLPFVSAQGLYNGSMVVFTLSLLVVFTAVLTFTTSPLELVCGFEYLLSPLDRVGIDSHEIAIIMMISLRFIPFLLEECDKLIKCQTARGANFTEGRLLARARSLTPIFIPLFLSSIRRAEELAIAMESRGYQGRVGRTSFRKLQLARIDFIATAAAGLFFAALWALQLLATS